MIYQNLSYDPGVSSLYAFPIFSESGIPAVIAGLTFRFEIFDETGIRLYLSQTPDSIVNNIVSFSLAPVIAPTPLTEGNYGYKVTSISQQNLATTEYKGFITVVNPVELPDPVSLLLVAADISDFDTAAVAAVTPFVEQYVAEAIAQSGGGGGSGSGYSVRPN